MFWVYNIDFHDFPIGDLIQDSVSWLDEEVRILKNPHLIVGHLQDILDDERAIVRSSNGTVFQVSTKSTTGKR